MRVRRVGARSELVLRQVVRVALIRLWSCASLAANSLGAKTEKPTLGDPELIKLSRNKNRWYTFVVSLLAVYTCVELTEPGGVSRSACLQVQGMTQPLLHYIYLQQSIDLE